MFGSSFYKAAGVALGLIALAVAFAPQDSRAHTAPATQTAPVSQTAPAPAAQSSAAVAGHPEMWVAKGPEGTLYLLGSFHLLKPGRIWEDSRIDGALNAADHVWFEVTGFDDMAASQGLFLKYGLYAAPELSHHLDEAEAKHLDEVLTRHGLSLGAMQMFKPWA
ncbi:MAG: TraB/GumN family protein, partial [Asticcacaulis sp.]